MWSIYVMTFLVFINGSMNSGKTTTAMNLATKLGTSFIDLDDIRAEYDDLNLSDAIPLVLSKAARRINEEVVNNRSVIACYVLSEKNYDSFISMLGDYPKFFYTLNPELNSITQQRGERHISNDEIERIKYHYAIGINKPSFGKNIDNTHLSIDEVGQIIVDDIQDV